MIFDSEQQKKDFMEMLYKFPAPSAAAGHQLISAYVPVINSAAVIPVDKQREFVDKVFPSKEEKPDAARKG